MSWRDDLRAIIERAPESELLDLVGELARGQARAQERLSPARAQNERNVTASLDRYLTAEQVADRLAVSLAWVYANRELLGGSKIGGNVRFPERAIIRYLQSAA